jgi:hypothetical protein
VGGIAGRHVTTVCRVTPSRSAIAVFDSPSAAASTIRARNTRPAGSDDDRVQGRSKSRSASGSNYGAAEGTRPSYLPSRSPMKILMKILKTHLPYTGLS